MCSCGLPTRANIMGKTLLEEPCREESSRDALPCSLSPSPGTRGINELSYQAGNDSRTTIQGDGQASGPSGEKQRSGRFYTVSQSISQTNAITRWFASVCLGKRSLPGQRARGTVLPAKKATFCCGCFEIQKRSVTQQLLSVTIQDNPNASKAK